MKIPTKNSTSPTSASATGAPTGPTTTSRTDPAEDLTGRVLVDERSQHDNRFFTHLLTVLSVSSAMVGVCLTAIGLVGVMKSLGKVETVVDDLLAVAAVLFMSATLLSFLGMRTNLTKNWRSFARVLDSVFCAALVLVVVATLLLTWVVL